MKNTSALAAFLPFSIRDYLCFLLYIIAVLGNKQYLNPCMKSSIPTCSFQNPNHFLWPVATRALKFLCRYRNFPSLSGFTHLSAHRYRWETVLFFAHCRKRYSPSLLKFKYRNGAQRESRPKEGRAIKKQNKELTYSHAQDKDINF